MGNHRRKVGDALSMNHSSQPKMKRGWGRQPAQACMALLVATADESPGGGADHEFVLWYMEKRSPKLMADLPRAIRQMLMEYKVETST